MSKNIEVNENNISPMMAMYQETKKQYQDCILFYRLGDFYEMFNEDAILASKILDLTLTGKSCGNNERAPMCGVPHHAYEPYVQKLIERGYKVAICEQTNEMENKVMKRKVVRIITPGTVVDSDMLNDACNSYMMSIVKNSDYLAYAYGDISTGEMFAGIYTGEHPESYLNDQLVRVSPAEIICNQETKKMENKISFFNNSQLALNVYYDWAFSYSNAEKNILRQYNLQSTKGYDFDVKGIIIAIGSLLEYFKETQKREFKHLCLPKIIKDEQYMYLDTNTRRNLEIEQTMHGGSKFGSLLWVLDKTETSGGSRMLRSWVRQPLQNKKDIEKRQDMIEFLVNNSLVRAELKQCFDKVQDIQRLVGKLSCGTFTPKDSIALSVSLSQVPDIKRAILTNDEPNFSALAKNLYDVTPIVTLINQTINPEATSSMKDGNYIKQGFNPQLDHLRQMRDNASQEISKMEAEEREATGIKNLKIGYNRVFGYYIEVGKQFAEQVPYNYVRKQTISNNERYITERLKNFEQEVVSSKESALVLEEEIFQQFKTQLMQNSAVMQQIATTISEIDCLLSLAVVAVNNDYTRPIIAEDKTLKIIAGRHPVIEKLGSSAFIPNDCLLNTSDQRTIILTGPNMAGKSTFMRQVALITYMAHIGSFVPAESAEICIVDRIFTRIGASDDLAVGQSTFMVEMIEVANILNYSTNNSLIILDEVGRGTSTFDGLSIAWAVVEYLSTHLKAKTLFATHYHELMQLEGIYEGVKNYCISIKEIGGKLVFLRKIMRGSATKSYGIEVANLAGLPNGVIDRARELMKQLENQQPKSTDSTTNELIDILKEIDINKLTPLGAFDTLTRLIDMVK